MSDTPLSRPGLLGWWLLVVAALVFAIVMVGGVTRLTESGLSITEWDPILGAIPPLTHAQWERAFDGYKAIPQYRAFNQGMTLAGFQHIFFWEYLHRLLARAIGTVLGLVLLVFWWKRWIPAGFGWRTLLILALGALQGLVGWWMVASGLEVRTEVSHLRLAVHLLTALLIYAVLIWSALDLFAIAGGRARARLRWAPALAIAALAVQIMLGAFTAGLRAGYAFASWPRMGEDWFPAGGWQPGLGLLGNVSSNPVVVQFEHRWWAWLVAAATALLARAAWRRGAGAAASTLIGAVALQILLGIGTLLSGVAFHLAIAHQATAVILLGAAIWCAYAAGYADTVRKQSGFA